MSNVTLYLPDNVKKELDDHCEVRWSEVIRQAVIAKLQELRKLQLLKKYVEKEQFTEADLAWMDDNDWHPVDESRMRLSYVRDVNKISRGKFLKVNSVKDLFK